MSAGVRTVPSAVVGREPPAAASDGNGHFAPSMASTTTSGEEGEGELMSTVAATAARAAGSKAASGDVPVAGTGSVSVTAGSTTGVLSIRARLRTANHSPPHLSASVGLAALAVLSGPGFDAVPLRSTLLNRRPIS